MLALNRCSHQFSWPRRSPEGEYYQVCVLCGDEYSYDWTSMRRLRQKPIKAVKVGAGRREGSRWRPRARRLRLSGLIHYRACGSDSWSDGELQNISQSGLLFAGTGSLPEGALIDAELEMPAEICGSRARRVRCRAQVVRIGAERGANICAVQIFGYVFMDPSDEHSRGPATRGPKTMGETRPRK
jgi:hypothetical protein